MDISEAFEAAIPLGRTQILIFIATSLMHIETSFITLSNVFLATTPPYHCANHSGFLLNESVPRDGEGVYSTCSEYSNPGSGDNETRDCSRWEFDTDTVGKSIVSDWSLVCGQDFLSSLAQTIVLAGFAVGSPLGGPVADRYGRRVTIIVALILVNIFGVSTSFTQSYVVFVVLRFLMSTIFKAVRIPIVNLLYETLLPRHRSFCGAIASSVGSFGQMAMAGIAYLIRDWRYLNIVLMIPTIVLMLFSWLIPESVRWLVSQGKHQEAEKTMQHIATFNGAKNFPSPALRIKDDDHAMADPEDIRNDPDQPTATVADGNAGRLKVFGQLFRQPILTVTLILSFNWVIGTLSYFGFALTTGSLAGDPYLNFFISSSADLSSQMLGAFVLKRIGAIRTVIFGLVVASAMITGLIGLSYSDDNVASGISTTVIAFLGRFFLVFSLLPVSLLMSDLYPTPVRNTGTATVQLIGNIGSMIAPQVIYLNKYISNFSFFVMLGGCLVSAFLTVLLPETVGFKQPETTEDLQELFDNNRVIHCGCLKDQQSVGEPELKRFSTGNVNLSYLKD